MGRPPSWIQVQSGALSAILDIHYPSRKWVICHHGSESANHYLGKPVQEEQKFHQSEFQYQQESFPEEWDDYWAKLKYTREKLLEECNSLQVQDNIREKWGNMQARVEFLEEKLQKINLQAYLQFQQRKYQKTEGQSKRLVETHGVESNPMEQQPEWCGDYTQPPDEALCAKVIDGKKEDLNKKETFQEEVNQDASVWGLIDQPPTLLGMIEELHMKWSRGHLPDRHSANESDFTSDNSENEEATQNWILSKKIRKDYNRLDGALEDQCGRRNQPATVYWELQKASKEVQDPWPKEVLKTALTDPSHLSLADSLNAINRANLRGLATADQ